MATKEATKRQAKPKGAPVAKRRGKSATPAKGRDQGKGKGKVQAKEGAPGASEGAKGKGEDQGKGEPSGASPEGAGQAPGRAPAPPVGKESQAGDQGRPPAQSDEQNSEGEQGTTLQSPPIERGREVVGYKVWWDLLGCQGRLEDLKVALEKVGLDGLMPEPLSPGQMIHQVFSRRKNGLHVEFKSAGVSGPWLTYRPVRFAKGTEGAAGDHHALTVNPEVLSSISLNKESGQIVLQNADCPVGKVVVTEYEALKGCFVGRQIRTLLCKVLEDHLHAAKLRRGGGFYCVPPVVTRTAEEEARTGIPAEMMVFDVLLGLQEVVQGIGSCELYLEKVLADTDTHRAASRSAMRSLDGKYSELLSGAQEFIDQLDTGDLCNGRSLAAKVKAARDLRRHAEFYRELLDERGEKIKAAADILEKVLGKATDATVSVRALRKIEGSERATEAAAKTLREIVMKANADLQKAREAHVPTTANEEEQE